MGSCLADLSSYIFYFFRARKSYVELGRMAGSTSLFLIGNTIASTRQVELPDLQRYLIFLMKLKLS